MSQCDFPDVSFFIHGSQVGAGSIMIFPTTFCNAIVLKEDNCTTENPLFHDKYLLTPLTDPYLVKDHYHFVNLAFFTEMTFIDEPARLSLHDSTQEAGITINFVDKEQCEKFFDYLTKFVTVLKCGNAGLFKILSQYQSFYPNKEFPNINDDLKSQFLKSPLLNQGNFSSMDKHTHFTSLVSSYFTNQKTDNISIEQAFQSLESMKEYIQFNKIDHSQKAKVWAFLLNIDLNKIEDKLVQQYMDVKKQWASIRFSQYKRTKLFQDHINQLSSTIMKFKQKLLSVVRDFSILQFTFNILMSVAQVYYYFHQHYTELLYMIRVFYSFLVDKIIFKGENNEPYIVVNDETTLDSQSFETVVFWSMIAIIEKGKIQNHLFNLDNNHIDTITSHIGDVLFVADPLLFSFSFGKSDKIKELVPVISTAMSNSLSLCDCSDMWIAALSSENASLFLDFVVIASLVIIFSDKSLNDSSSTINENLSFRTNLTRCKHRDMIRAAFGLIDKYPELMS